MSNKRTRQDLVPNRYKEEEDYDDSEDEDYQPSDEEESQKINPNQSGREKIKRLPDHLKNVKIADLNRIHFDIYTSFNVENETDEIKWEKERSIFLVENILHGDEDEMFSKAQLVRNFTTYISKFDQSATPSTSESSSMSEQVKNEDEKKKKKQVLLSIQCRNKGNLNIMLKFFIGGEAVTGLNTEVPKKQVVEIHGYDDTDSNLRKKLLIDEYEPISQSSSSSSTTPTNSGTYLRDFGSIKIEVYQAIKEKVEIDEDEDEEDENEDEDEEKYKCSASSSTDVEKISRYTQNVKQQERCGMQVAFKASRIERPKKKTKRSGKKRRSKYEFKEGPLLFQSVFKYRSYLGFLCELNEHNIDLGKTKNMARGRMSDNESSSSEDESENDENERIKTEDDGGFIDITDDVEEAPKIIPTVSLDSDDDSDETDVKPTAAELERHTQQSSSAQASSASTSSSSNNTTISNSQSEYSFKETIQDIESKNVNSLIQFIKVNDEALYEGVQEIFRKFKVSGSDMLSNTLNYKNMGVNIKYQIKILQIVDRINENSV